MLNAGPKKIGVGRKLVFRWSSVCRPKNVTSQYGPFGHCENRDEGPDMYARKHLCVATACTSHTQTVFQFLFGDHLCHTWHLAFRAVWANRQMFACSGANQSGPVGALSIWWSGNHVNNSTWWISESQGTRWRTLANSCLDWTLCCVALPCFEKNRKTRTLSVQSMHCWCRPGQNRRFPYLHSGSWTDSCWRTSEGPGLQRPTFFFSRQP